NGLQNLAAMPGQLLGLEVFNLERTEYAFAVGLTTIAAMLGWEKYRPASLRLLPGALVGVVAGTLLALIFSLDVSKVIVPASIVAAVDLPTGAGWFTQMVSPAIIGSALAIAFIASAETLLSAAAVDRMHSGVRTDYNKELRAQGVGNLLCGVAGSLPMTGVIVRSSANVQAGALTRVSTILHGVWILAFVAALPWVLQEIPMAALGAILVITGVRLVSLKHVKHLFRDYGPLPAAIWAVTMLLVVVQDLLIGVLVGIALSLLELIPHLRKLRLRVDETDNGEGRSIALTGAATLVSLPKLSDTLERVPNDMPVTIDVSQLSAVDHSSAEMLRDWLGRRRASGVSVEVTGDGGRLPALVG
ncbi:MAG TPA: SulP family inorganic anion transporter, partial [Sphingomonas sp.]